MSRLLLIISFCIFSTSSPAQIFKCVDSDGRLTYSKEKRGCEKDDYLMSDDSSVIKQTKPKSYKNNTSIKNQVYVKYRGEVSLETFTCNTITRSSLIRRLCYDKAESYVIVNLNGTNYHYCEVPESFVNEWMNATSMGKFFNSRVKGGFDCRVKRMPQY